jgi:hypothetical protein
MININHKNVASLLFSLVSVVSFFVFGRQRIMK